MTAAAVHHVVVAIVFGRLVMVVRVAVGMAFRGRSHVGEAPMLVMIALRFRKFGGGGERRY
jgi:hypothetical protein